MLSAICEGLGYGKDIVSLQILEEMKSLLAETIAEKGELTGLKEARRDLLLPGWCVLSGLMEAYNVPIVRFSATALREGMLDFMVKNEKTLPRKALSFKLWNAISSLQRASRATTIR